MYASFLFQTTKTVIIEDHLDTIQIYSKEWMEMEVVVSGKKNIAVL